MARSRNNSFKNLSRKLEDIQKEIQKTEEDIKKIAQDGKEKAQETLAEAIGDDNFTQKAGGLLVDEIGVVKVSNREYQIVAPMSGNVTVFYNYTYKGHITSKRGQTMQSYYNLPLQMYFAEYGAGIGSSPQRAIRATSGYTAKYVRKDGKWSYADLKGIHQVVKTSKAVGYMSSARKQMKEDLKEVKKRISANIRTRIKRNR